MHLSEDMVESDEVVYPFAKTINNKHFILIYMFNKIILNYLYLLSVLILICVNACDLKGNKNITGEKQSGKEKTVVSIAIATHDVVSDTDKKKSCCVKPPSKNKMILQSFNRKN